MAKRLERIDDWAALAEAADYEPGRMAALCPVSLRHLERHFLQHFRLTPGQWIRQQRCGIAREMIAHGHSNRMVAKTLKFAGESHFCREFKKVFGVSPQSLVPAFGRSGEMSDSGKNVGIRT